MCMDTTVEAPEPRDLAQETGDTLQTQIDLAPDVFAANANPEYGQPAWADLGLQTAFTTLTGSSPTIDMSNAQDLLNQDPSLLEGYQNAVARGDIRTEAQWLNEHFASPAGEAQRRQTYDAIAQNPELRPDDYTPGYLEILENYISPAVARSETASNTERRTGDVDDAEALGGRLNEIVRSSNPEYAAAMESLSDMGSGDGRVEGLTGMLYDQAVEELEAGGNLTDEEMAWANEATRSSFDALGRSNSNAAIFTEALNRSNLSNQRKRERQSFGGSVAQMLQGIESQDRGFALDKVNTLGGQTIDPIMALTGRTSIAPSASQGAYSQSYGTQAQPMNSLDPFNAYAADLYNTNYNADAAANIASANNSAAMGSGLVSTAGTIGATKIMFMCIPEGQTVDVIEHESVPIEDLAPGDWVIGLDGEPEQVLQVHNYLEEPSVKRWVQLELLSGETVESCDKHLINGKEAQDYKPGDMIGENQVVAVDWFDGVHASYDLLTASGGYMCNGVPVQSMIPLMAQAIAEGLTNEPTTATFAS